MSQEARNWANLDGDLLASIFAKVGAADVLQHAQWVCKTWRNVSSNPCIWKVVEFKNIKGEDGEAYLEQMAREAVKRSKGQMEELRIEGFGSNGLLEYIANRTSSLKRLHLLSAENIGDDGLINIAGKQPQLEELDITFGFCTFEIFKAIGKACPNLSCLRYNQAGDVYEPFTAGDDEAYAIADSMPQLRVLQLVGNPLTNKGIIRILDKRKRLESLDIRCCIHVVVNAEVEAKAKGLKEFRLPGDSTADIYGEASLAEVTSGAAGLLVNRDRS